MNRLRDGKQLVTFSSFGADVPCAYVIVQERRGFKYHPKDCKENDVNHNGLWK